MRAITIYLIDDSAADAELIKLVAQQAKLTNTIEHFDSGEIAIDALLDEHRPLPDLILLDLNMPGLSGHEVLKRIRNEERTSLLPVVILTSSEDESDVVRGYGNHANAYVVKPVQLSGFQAIVHAIDSFWFSVVKLPPRH